MKDDDDQLLDSFENFLYFQEILKKTDTSISQIQTDVSEFKKDSEPHVHSSEFLRQT